MSELVSRSRQGRVGILTIHNPPVNALSPGVPEGLVAGVEAFQGDPDIEAVVVIGGGRTFIAGADIREFGKITSGEKRDIGLAPLIDRIEQAAKPVIMAIHGQALGGGLEVAMGGHYRIMTAEAKAGQPEVKLGLIPGAGGTQRLPRLIGIPKALELCALGEPVGAQEALAIGLVDAVVEGDLLSYAVEFAQRQISVRRTCDLPVRAPDGDPASAVRAAARERFRGRLAPERAIEAVMAAARLPFPDGLAWERRLFEECLFSEQSKALIHVFFGEREVARAPGLGKDLTSLPIRRAAVVGAGTMGIGITLSYLNAGLPVRLKEISPEALDRAVSTIRGHYDAAVAKGRLSEAEAGECLRLLTTQTDWQGFDEADVIIEAAYENLALKREIFAELDRVARPGAILATNTSTLDIDAIAAATQRPEWVVGHHFFSPAHVMRLLEIVRGRATSPEVLVTSLALAKKLNKVGVVVGNGFGFVGNRMFGPYRREAERLVLEGAAPEAVDAALYDWGMAMGPLAVGDLAGLDVGWRIRQERPAEAGRAPIEDRLCALGRFGQKTGAGWYRYDEHRRPTPDPEVARVIAEARAAEGLTPRPHITAQEIVERCLGALVAEGRRVLAEGIASRPVDIDMIYVFGYGFPAHRGGPMFHAGVRA